VDAEVAARKVATSSPARGGLPVEAAGRDCRSRLPVETADRDWHWTWTTAGCTPGGLRPRVPSRTCH